MRKEEVSLWIGNFENEIVVDKYLEIDYDENIDRIGSTFENNFSIDYFSEKAYDEDSIERKFFGKKKTSIENLIKGLPYDMQIIPKFKEAIKDLSNIEGNFVLLVYNYRYHEKEIKDIGEGYDIKYLATVQYEYEQIMRKQEVSLWIGNFENEIVVDKYLEIAYDENGDSIRSTFENNFIIDCFLEETYDEDFIERKFFENKKTSIENLIKGSSYDMQIIPKFKEAIKDSSNIEGNFVLLVYNFRYHGKKIKDIGEGYDIEYLATVQYEY